MNDAHREVADRILSSRALFVMTGAGASAESGVPTFRDALAGLWDRFDPAELATPEAFAADPALVGRWYAERRRAVLACEPNDGHRALAAIQRALEADGRRFTIATQNVDGLHQRAGSRRVFELHGSLLRWRQADGHGPALEGEALEGALAAFPARAPSGALLRPDVVWFGEGLPEEALRVADSASRRAEVFLSVGTSGIVYPAAALAQRAAARDAFVVEVNPNTTPLSAHASARLTDGASADLSALAHLIAPTG